MAGVVRLGMVNWPTGPVVGVALVTVFPLALALMVTPPSGAVPLVTVPEMVPFAAVRVTLLAIRFSPPPSSSVSVPAR